MESNLVLDLTAASPTARVTNATGSVIPVPLGPAGPLWQIGAPEPDSAVLAQVIGSALAGARMMLGSNPEGFTILHPADWPPSTVHSLGWLAQQQGMPADRIRIQPMHPASYVPGPGMGVAWPAPHLPAPPRSKAPLIVGLSVAVVAVLVIAGAVFVLVSRGGGDTEKTASGSSSSATRGTITTERSSTRESRSSTRTRTTTRTDRYTTPRPSTASTYGAYSVDTTTGSYGWAHGASSPAEAISIAASHNPGNDDKHLSFGPGQCGALAFGTGRMAIGYGPDTASAKQEAIMHCSVGDCKVVHSICSDPRRS